MEDTKSSFTCSKEKLILIICKSGAKYTTINARHNQILFVNDVFFEN